jgi:hypothetical protein
MFRLNLNPEVRRTVRRAVPMLVDNLMVRVQTPKSLERFPLPASRRFNQASRELHQIIDEIVTHPTVSRL